MANFIAIWRQVGEGCDYTIGCGIRVVEFEADNLDAAREAQLSNASDELESIQIFQLAGPNCRIDASHWGPALAAAREAEQKAEQDRKDRIEYDRLSRKFSRG